MRLSLALLAITTVAWSANACEHSIDVSETMSLSNDVNGDSNINPGDTVQYIVTLTNVGSTSVPTGGFSVVNVLNELVMQTLVPGSVKYADPNSEMPCPDHDLQGNGLVSVKELPAGSVHMIKFEAIVDDIDSIFMTKIGNGGILDYTDNSCTDEEFSVSSPLTFEPQVTLIKTMHKGHDVKCEEKVVSLQSGDQKRVQGVDGTPVTVCYQITNTGKTYLDPKEIQDPDLPFTSLDFTNSLAPKESAFASHKITIDTPLNQLVSTTASVAANPIFYRLDPIPGFDDVVSSSTAGLLRTMKDVDVTVTKSVHLNHWDVASCSEGRPIEQGNPDKAVTYCYEIVNTGKTYLTDVTVTDADIDFSASLDDPLAPGDSAWLGYQSAITETVISTGEVSGLPSDDIGAQLTGAEVITKDGSQMSGVVMHLMQELSKDACPPGGYMGKDVDGVKD